MAVDDDPYDRHYGGGLTDAEARAVAYGAAMVAAADPLAIHVSVTNGATRAVLAMIDRSVDAPPANGPGVVFRADLVIGNGIKPDLRRDLTVRCGAADVVAEASVG